MSNKNQPENVISGSIIPGRPFGLSVAVLASSALFGLIPLLYGLLLLYISSTVYSNQTMLSGLQLAGLSLTAVYVQMGAAGLFLLAAAVAWRGKPAWMRPAFVVIVLIYTMLSLTAHITQSTLSLDSGMGARGWLNMSYITVLPLNALFVIWYLSRWPARAFFRGHYTEDELTRIQRL